MVRHMKNTQTVVGNWLSQGLVARFAISLLAVFCLAGVGAASSLPVTLTWGITVSQAVTTQATEDNCWPNFPIQLNVERDFNFGSLAVNGAGTAVLTPSGTLSTTGGVISVGGFPEPAILALKGHPKSTYTLMLPSSVTLTNSTGATLILREFTYSPGTTGELHSSKEDVYVGGTLYIQGNQPAGSYHGNLDVIVTYD